MGSSLERGRSAVMATLPRRRLRPGAICGLVVALVGSWAGSATAGERVRIDGLEVERGAETIRVGFRLEGTMPDDVVERLEAGIAVTFRHRVELVTRRFLLAPSRLRHRCEIETTVRFDALTKRYRLERVTRHEGADGVGPEPAVESDATDDLNDVRAWLTEVDGVRLPMSSIDGIPPERARIRVSSVLGRRFVLFMFPTAISASAEAELVS